MKRYLLFLSIFAIFICAGSVAAQSKAKKRKTPAATVQPSPTTASSAKENTETSDSAKKNQRPSISGGNADASKKSETIINKAVAKFPYGYEFSQPDFLVQHVWIEHDETGKGKITFEKRELAEPITDPIQISSEALERIKNFWNELNFVDSSENYQSATYDYKHLGQMKLRLEQAGKKRETEFNWTENKIAESLTKEYKRLTEQFIWMFDINLARENQPLEAPKLMDKLENLIKRGEISDANQMLPVLREASNDERIPLIARNRAGKLVKVIEKQSEKKSNQKP